MLKKIFVLVFLLVVGISLTVFVVFRSQTVGQCYRLEGLAKDKKIQKTLLEWVGDNIDNSIFDASMLERSTGIFPGEYKLKGDFDDFDWDLLGMDPTLAQVRIIADRNARGDFDFSDIQAVSFTDRSRVSIIVRTKKASSFGIRDEKYLTHITPSIAVYCSW
jgi:hypothetical protein